MKSEPEVYSIDDLAREGTTLWTGVRNYQARNLMQAMATGDRALFYHSNAAPPGVAGTMLISGRARPDPTQFDPKDDGYDPRAAMAAPVWQCVEVTFEARARKLVGLPDLRAVAALATMELLRKGSRLSVQSVAPAAFRKICRMAGLE